MKYMNLLVAAVGTVVALASLYAVLKITPNEPVVAVKQEDTAYEQLPDYIRRVDDHERGVSCYYRNSGQFSCVHIRN